MFRPFFGGLAALLLALATGGPAAAQYAAGTVGEDYVVEFGTFFWNPTPEIIIQTEDSTILGTPVDLVQDFGITDEWLPDLRFVLHPARKHKFRVSYTPIEYSADSVIERTIIFNGTTYRVGLPVTTDFEWKAWRFGYEYDFIKRDHGYVGLIAEAKYTDVALDIASLGLAERTSARLPIPAIGGTFRVYALREVALTGEVTGIQLPGSLTDGEDTADYLEWDLSVTINFARTVGAQVGYRSIDVNYRYNQEFGDFKVKGPYFGGVVRY